MSLKVSAAQRSAAFPGGLPNEDRTAFKTTPRGFYAWVIDGAAAPDPTLRVPDGRLAGAWLADQLSDALWAVSDGGGDLRAILRGAVERVGPAWRALGLDWPDWAQPVAALSLLALRSEEGGLRADGLSLGDCPVGVLRAGGEAEALHAWNEPLDGEARLGAGRESEAAMVEALKTQRLRERTARPFRRLTLDPDCAADAVSYSAQLSPGDRLIAASDGTARAWKEYGIESADDAARRLGTAAGFEVLVGEMRPFERERYAKREDRLVKVGDDASVVIIALD